MKGEPKFDMNYLLKFLEADSQLSVEAYRLYDMRCKDKSILLLHKNYIQIISVKKENMKMLYKNVESLIKNKDGSELIIRLNTEEDYYCTTKVNNVVAAMKKNYTKNTTKELKVFEIPQSPLKYWAETNEERKRSKSMREDSFISIYKSPKNIIIEQNAKLIYYREGKVALSLFTYLKPLDHIFQTEEETLHFITRDEVEMMMSVIEINKWPNLKSIKPEHIREEARKNKDCSFLMQPEYIYMGKENIYIITKFIPVTNLAEVLRRRKRLNERNVRFYGCQIALGLKHLHSEGVVYNALNCENVLLGKDGYIRLRDFGVYRLLPSEKQKMEYVDLESKKYPEYYAPEVLLKRKIDFASDWWSLGIVLYELLVGITPFHSVCKEQMNCAIKSKNFFFPPVLKYHILISGAAKELVISLLKKKVEDRLDKAAVDHPFFVTREWDLNSLLEKKADTKYIDPSKNLLKKENDDPITQLYSNFAGLNPFKNSASNINNRSMTQLSFLSFGKTFL